MKTTLIRQINSDRNSHQDTSDEKAFNPLVKDCWLKLVIHTHVLQRICKICRIAVCSWRIFMLRWSKLFKIFLCVLLTNGVALVTLKQFNSKAPIKKKLVTNWSKISCRSCHCCNNLSENVRQRVLNSAMEGYGNRDEIFFP